MRLPISLPVHLDLKSTRDGGVRPVAQNLVNDILVLLKIIIRVRVVLMLGVLQVHSLPRDIRNAVLQLSLVPGFELRGTRLGEKGAWPNPLGNLTGGIPSLCPMGAQRPGSLNPDVASNIVGGDGALGCLVSCLACSFSRACFISLAVSLASLNASTASLARPVVHKGGERLKLSLVKRMWWGDSPDGVGKSWWAWMALHISLNQFFFGFSR